MSRRGKIRSQTDIDAVRELLIQRRDHPAEGLSFKTIQERTGVPVSTIQTWNTKLELDDLDSHSHARWESNRAGAPQLLGNDLEEVLAGTKSFLM